jgi:predicted ATPase/class 3 adenylate cyclase
MSLAAPLPTGAVTFAFTDIEGSTARWERDRAAMQEAVRRHDAILRAAITGHDGHVFKTLGDAFCAVFARPDDAVAAMLAAQQALAAQDFSAVDGLRVRVALHTGSADERDGDYFGPALNRVARLLSVGHGGQILISSATRELARGDLPAGSTLTDLGSHRLRDLTEPEQVWQLAGAGLPAEFPPLRSLDAFPNNLPLPRTTFVGREHDLAEVKRLLDRHRLLTLTGSGGVGKTRLAIQVGADLLDRYPDGVWFVDLAPIDDPELVSSVTAQALGMSQQQGQRVDEAIPIWLKRKNLLLILDNCEHVLETVAALANGILATAQDVRILATSRQALTISGEAVYALPSLAVPADAAGLKSDDARGYGAIALFVDRAKAADTRFTLTDDNAAIVAEICRRLDGIALAIELAAARVNVLSISKLAQRLSERFKLLTGGSRDVLPRQKTLTALIDWSYDLLTPQEQILFNRLGVFAGGFSLDAAGAVCGGEGLDELDLLDLLSSLTDKSLVVADTSGETERYRLLESTAAYALEKLTASDERERVARRHALYFRERAEVAYELRLGLSVALTADIELELDNYRAALEWALTQGNDGELGGAIAGALGAQLLSAGLVVEARYWSERALARISETDQPAIAARIYFALSTFFSGERKLDAAQRAMDLYESAGDRRRAAIAQLARGFALYQMGHLEEARDAMTRALGESRACGDALHVARALTQLANVAWTRGDFSAARESYAQALAGYKKIGAESNTASVLINMAELEFAARDPARALRLANEALDISIRGKHATNVASVYTNIAAYCIALDDLEGARGAATEGLRRARQAQAEHVAAITLQHLALLAALGGNPRQGARLLGYVDARYEQLGLRREATEQWEYNKLQTTLRETLSEGEITALAVEGAAWLEDQAAEEALRV